MENTWAFLLALGILLTLWMVAERKYLLAMNNALFSLVCLLNLI